MYGRISRTVEVDILKSSSSGSLIGCGSEGWIVETSSTREVAKLEKYRSEVGKRGVPTIV